jgi:beta-phosphoglucomutase-like phosphatase (HAD superfamily)
MKPNGIIKAVLFDLDGTLLDTESLSDKAILKAFGNSIPKKIQEERRQDGDRLPWEIKRQIVGKRGDEWVPMVIAYAETNWVVGDDQILSPMPSV